MARNSREYNKMLNEHKRLKFEEEEDAVFYEEDPDETAEIEIGDNWGDVSDEAEEC